jgi:predicted deacylase
MNIIVLFFILLILFIILQFYCNNIEVYEFDSKVKGIHLLLIGGTHGNEPSGSVALTKFIKEMKEKRYVLKTGKITIIPKPNKLGYLFNKRNLLHRFYNKDLNRNYPRNAKEKPLDPISAKIMDYVNKSNWILDFHEGWGYIYENKGSMGSGIFPGNTQNSITMANNILTSINSAINGENKFGLQEGIHPNIRSLKSYANYLQKNYILIETSGQNDIQPIHIRVEQILFIIDFFLRFNDMI